MKKIFILAILILSMTLLAEDHISSLLSYQEKSIDSLMEKSLEKQQLASIAIGIISKGEIVFVKAYGFADLKNKISANKNTIYNWASNSKPLMAVLAMQLAEKGRLDIDVDIKKYLPGLPLKEKITVRQLMSHQSGIPHYKNGEIISEKNIGDMNNPLNSIKKFYKSPLLFEPGGKYSYSSYAYILLSAVVQAAGKEPLQQQLNKRIIKPLGIQTFQLDVKFRKQKDWSKGYIKPGKEATEQAHYWKHGAGAYKSSVEDFTKWAASLMNDSILKVKTKSLMWTKQTTKNGSKIACGLGFYVSKKKSGLFVSHSGLQNEVRTLMQLNVDRKSGIVIMTNCSYADLNSISKSIFEIFEFK